jgi:Phage phiEco32-like COOH.NH2 ligase-type 2
MASFTLGADPEGFLINSKGKPISSIGLIGGTKQNPLPVPGGSLQEDNVLIEFNTIPANSLAEWLEGIDIMKKQAAAAAAVHGLSVLYTSGMSFSKDQLTHPKATQSGCDPDYNVYTKMQNEYPPLDNSFRGAGGHIHIGHELVHSTPDKLPKLLRYLDCYVGYPLKCIEGESLRDRTYGKYGNYRPKRYGVEFRTPSSFWVSSNQLTELVYLLTDAAVNTWERGRSRGLFDIHSVDKGIKSKHLQLLPSTVYEAVLHYYSTYREEVKNAHTK